MPSDSPAPALAPQEPVRTAELEVAADVDPRLRQADAEP